MSRLTKITITLAFISALFPFVGFSSRVEDIGAIIFGLVLAGLVYWAGKPPVRCEICESSEHHAGDHHQEALPMDAPASDTEEEHTEVRT